jgi:uncharacterized protein YqcC (DUF446 family)
MHMFEPVLVLLKNMLPTKSMILMKPIDPGSHLLCSLYGMPTVKMLGWMYKIFINRMKKCLDQVNYLRNQNLVPNSEYSSVITGDTWAQRMLKTRPKQLPLQFVAQAYLQHAWLAQDRSPEGRANIKNWRCNVRPSAPFEPLRSKIATPKTIADAFLAREPEQFPQIVSWDKIADQHVAHHPLQATSLGQSTDWKPPPAKIPSKPASGLLRHGSMQAVLSTGSLRDERLHTSNCTPAAMAYTDNEPVAATLDGISVLQQEL